MDNANSFENLQAPQLKRFVEKLCHVTKRYENRHKEVKKLDMHIDKIKKKKIPKDDIEFLKSQIGKVLEASTKILSSQKKDIKTENELKKKIMQLESDLIKTEKERDEALSKNQEQIKILNESLNSLRDKITTLIEDKAKREKKIRHLESRARKN